MEYLHKKYLLVKDNTNKLSLLDKEQIYLDYLKLEQINLKQQDFWSIISDYIDGLAGVNITQVEGKAGSQTLSISNNALTASKIINFVSTIEHISAITLMVKHVGDNTLTVFKDGMIDISYSYTNKISPYVQDLLISIPALIRENDIQQDSSSQKWVC